MRLKQRTRAFKMIATVMLCALALGACAPKPKINSYWGKQPRAELETWAANEVDIAIEATGVGVEGWKLEDKIDGPSWHTERELALEQAGTMSCYVEGAPWYRPAQLQFSVVHEGVEHAFAIAEYVRARWTKGGWTVTDIRRPEDMPTAEFPYFYIRADKPGEREGFAFRANVNLLAIDIYSACSDHDSMRW